MAHCDVNDSFPDKWAAIGRLKIVYDLYEWGLDKRLDFHVQQSFLKHSVTFSLLDKRFTFGKILIVRKRV